MGDIKSRIVVEAQGADAAAREIRKLKAAYDEVAQSARNLSPNTGGGDPFTAATSPPGAGVLGGQRSPADTNDQVRRNDEWRQGADDRLRGNQNFPSSTGGAPAAFGASTGNMGNAIQSAFGSAQQAGAGQSVGAAGTAAKGLGSILGGPAGIALGLAGLVAAGTQAMAAPALERRQRITGGGVANRMGGNYKDVAHWEALMGSEGVYLPEVYGFTGAASQSGFSWNRPGANYGAQMAMYAQRDLGVDVSTSAGMLGELSRAGLSQGLRQNGMYGSMYGAFGAENVGRGVSGMTSFVAGRESTGIQVTPQAFENAMSLMTGLGTTGGLSVDAATGLTNRLAGRATSAAGLNSPEDIMAFAAMRGKGMSITDTMIAMESQPGAVTEAVYGQLQTRFADNPDALNMAFQKYTGGTMSETMALRKTLDAGGSYEDHIKDWQRGAGNEDAAMIGYTQNQLMFGGQEFAFDEVVSVLGKAAGVVMRGGVSSPGTVDYGDRIGMVNMEGVDEAIIRADTVIVANNVVTDDNEGGGALAAKYSAIGSHLGLTPGDYVTSFEQGWTPSQMLGGVGSLGGGEGMVYGDFAELTAGTADELLSDARGVLANSGLTGRAKRSASRTISETAMMYSSQNNPQLYSQIGTEEESLRLLQAIVDALAPALEPIHTDGDG